MVENYSLDIQVGEGQFGKVFKATNQLTQKEYAIKVIQIQKFKENPKLEECTVNEIKTLNQVNDCTHIVKFVELLRSSNHYYFVYEYCNGGTLEDLLKQKKFFKENEALQIFRQLLEAFKVLRTFNIMHRDLKPTNILLHDGVVKLADFGFCKSLSEPNQLTQTMLGSPLYMAPEILKGFDYCVKADIWSLGVVLYEILFGFCPFEEKSIFKLINLLNEGTFVVRHDIQQISPQTESLLYAMLVKDPEYRISWEQLLQVQISKEGYYLGLSKRDDKQIQQQKVLQNKNNAIEKNNTIEKNNAIEKKNNNSMDKPFQQPKPTVAQISSQNINISLRSSQQQQAKVQEEDFQIKKERSKLIYLVDLLMNIIDVFEDKAYDIILPQLIYLYHKYVINSRCNSINKYIQNNNLNKQLKNAIQMEIKAIEENFKFIQKEYICYEIHFQQKFVTEEVQVIQFNQTIKNFVLQALEKNNTNESKELVLCSKLVDLNDLDNIVNSEKDSEVENWAFLLNFNQDNCNKQKIMNKLSKL